MISKLDTCPVKILEGNCPGWEKKNCLRNKLHSLESFLRLLVWNLTGNISEVCLYNLVIKSLGPPFKSWLTIACLWASDLISLNLNVLIGKMVIKNNNYHYGIITELKEFLFSKHLD